MVNVNGAAVVVTGGQRGLGKAIVAELLDRGAAKIYATARVPKPSEDPRVIGVELDVTRPDSVAALATTAADAEIVINNAGVLGARTLLDSDIEEVRAVFETNYFGALRVAKAFAPVLADNGGGALVDIASILSWMPGSGGYGDSKAALWSMTNSLRAELEKQGTLVIAAHLSFTDTDMTSGFDAPKNDPRQVARAIVDGIEADDKEVLADDDTRYVKAALAGPVEALPRMP
ncbi:MULTISPECIES: SDR family oxidoreductase [Mycobacterium]|uniref:Short chain dehydrogenase family protein n=3 Tax=Mycobacterium avium complex (MAC) TaxID=120793 RepID=X8CDP9_MYCIT|nr:MULTISPECIES: SDR family oxidoreductase [Mycobacterium]EUA53946.1 short chain dehydrogenase family protein [Mycobacterium intracellulare 1956]AFC56670.1 short chain dehydrogenase [Mycobacterium paraintracellulare]AFJ38017.1 short chain dehydrogenase [Mycobacterium sp. MOTT36Y]AFS17141.1 short-chain dehydrogenase/reductase SDR [Mycobacterium intracellulare subsp. intracellulare MTCC 9506]ASX02841.1 short-chain dehydrogenase [Mycobacterium intracellulare subsp. chimaera]